MKEYIDVNVRVYRDKEKKIVTIPLETLVSEILPSQISVEFNDEALKAQAVIIRTNIVRRQPVYDGKGCELRPGADLCDTGHCMEWQPDEQAGKNRGDRNDEFWARIRKVVEDTRGQIIFVNQKPIKAHYHLCCGGATENSENLIGNRVVYLRKVLCSYCRNSTYWEQHKDITVEEIEKRLGIKVEGFGPVKGSPIEGFIDEIDRDNEGRIKSIKIGGKVFKGTEVKDLLGLNSTRFGWKPTVLKFSTGGRGHGLGMCQYGACAMAAEGSSYSDIINYYFTGVEIGSILECSEDMPLVGKVFMLDPGHGGDSSDNSGPGGLREKDVNLDIAGRLEALLQKAGAKVYMTRRGDTKVLLSDRADMANRIRPHFFISIHHNAFYNPSVSGTEIYYYNGDTEGFKLGRLIMEQLEKEVCTTNRGIKTANFYILREAKVRSVQLELFYITNPEEEARLKSEEFRSRVAKAVFNGVLDFYNSRF